MADDEEKKKILDSSFKGDDHNEKKRPTTTESPEDAFPAKVKKIAVKGELSKQMNENDDNSTTIQPATAVKSDDQDNSASSSSSEIPMMFEMDDIPAKVEIPASKSEILISEDTPSKLNLQLSDEAKRDILWQMNNKVNVNEKPMLEMDDIPAKVKMAAEAAKSETPDPRFPLKTDYPRAYGIGPLLETVVSESRLRPTIGERSSDKADRSGDDDGSSSDDESGKVSVSDDVKHGGEGNCSSDN